MGSLVDYAHLINALGDFLESHAQALLAEAYSEPEDR
jgi:hypothetical protein